MNCYYGKYSIVNYGCNGAGPTIGHRSLSTIELERSGRIKPSDFYSVINVSQRCLACNLLNDNIKAATNISKHFKFFFKEDMPYLIKLRKFFTNRKKEQKNLSFNSLDLFVLSI